MSIYTVVLFLHVSGAIGYFVGIGIWLFGLGGPDERAGKRAGVGAETAM